MTKDELLKLEPGTLVDVYEYGEFLGTHKFLGLLRDDRALFYGTDNLYRHEQLKLHVPQPQVSGTIETPPKLYTFVYGNSMLASEDQIMAQECVRESRNTINVLNEEIAKRNETIHNLRMRVEQLETPPTTDEVKHAYNALIAGGNRDEARVLQTLSHVVERLSYELTAKSGGRN